MFLSTLIPLAAILALPVWAQINMAQCASGFDWNKNSLGQDPCTVASLLDASCRDLAEYTFPPLNDTQYYLPPRANHSGDLTCDCNSVMYSLYMACASCQGGEIYSWTGWTPECVSTYVSRYPANIPDGTAVPQWAYYNVTLLPDQTWEDSVAMNTKRRPKEFLKRVDSAPTPDPSTPPDPSPPAVAPTPPPTIQSNNTPNPGMDSTDFPPPISAPSPTKVTIIKTPVGSDPTVTIDPPAPPQPPVPTNTPDAPAPMIITTTAAPPDPIIPTNTPTTPDPIVPTNTPASPDPVVPTDTPASPDPMTPTTTTTSPGSGENLNSSGLTIRTSTTKTSSPRPATPSTGANPLRPTGFSANGTNLLRPANAWASFVALFLWAFL